MTFEEAKKIMQEASPDMEIRSALDFGAFYLFGLAPPGMPEDETCDTGTIFPIVLKETGQCGEYDITSNLDAFLKAEKVL